MNDQMEGLVLKQADYKENDAMVTILFKEVGKLCLVGKGLLKDTSKNRAICAPYSCSQFQFDYEDSKSMFLLKTGSLVSSNYKIREDLTLLNAAALMAEITEKLTEANEPMEEFYEELKFCFERLHTGHNPKLTVAYFIARVLEEIGLEPNVDECVLCSEQSVNTISIVDGGFVCKNCAAQTETIPVDVAALKMFRYINKAKRENFEALEKATSLRLKDVKIFVDFLTTHSGITLESWAFFEECTN